MGQDRQAPHRPLQGDRVLWLCAGSLIPDPRVTGIVSAPVPKKLLLMAGTDNCYSSARGCTATLGNYAKAKLSDGTFNAIS